MSAADYCEFSGLVKDSCAHCTRQSRVLPDTMFQANEDDAHSRAPRVWITAEYPGRCARCRNQIVPGDRIGPSAGSGGWICENCGLPAGT